MVRNPGKRETCYTSRHLSHVLKRAQCQFTLNINTHFTDAITDDQVLPQVCDSHPCRDWTWTGSHAWMHTQGLCTGFTLRARLLLPNVPNLPPSYSTCAKKFPRSCPNDACPTALTAVILEWFSRLVQQHIRSILSLPPIPISDQLVHWWCR